MRQDTWGAARSLTVIRKRRERYRELLQSSTVIISIADSAKRVQEALDEIRGAIHSQQHPPAQHRVPDAHREGMFLSQSTSDFLKCDMIDAHLHTLQILTAHIKLLLDAPEQLWRLIERQKYFQAAWLFLLARVVHHALIRDDAMDEESWVNQGVDVLVSRHMSLLCPHSDLFVGAIPINPKTMGNGFTFSHANHP